jgi:hypothetical protein
MQVVKRSGQMRKASRNASMERRKREGLEAGDVNRSVRYKLPTGRATAVQRRTKRQGGKPIMCKSEAAGQH